MSQTETILLIVLGFSLASLIALFMGRMVWTMGVKLGVKRMQRQVPSTLVGLQTERNRLRAEYAMMAQRLGGRLEEAKLKAAEQMAEVSRHRNRLRELESGDGAKAEELRVLRTQVKQLEALQSEAAMREEDLRRRLADAEQSLRKLRRRAAGKVEEVAEAASETAAPPPPPTRPLSDDPEIRLRQRIDMLAGLAKTRGHGAEEEQQAPPPRPAASSGATVSEKVAEAERRNEDLEEQLRKLDEEWSAAPKNGEAANHLPQKADDTAEDNVISLSNRIRNLKKSLGSQ